MGGQLRIHLDPATSKDGSPQQGEGNVCLGRTWDIEPLLDRLVVFRSDVVDHEASLQGNSRYKLLAQRAAKLQTFDTGNKNLSCGTINTPLK